MFKMICVVREKREKENRSGKKIKIGRANYRDKTRLPHEEREKKNGEQKERENEEWNREKMESERKN